MSDSIIFAIYIASTFALAAGAIGAVFFRQLRKRDEIWRSLNLRLLLVTMPRSQPPEQGFSLEQIRERIGVMEQAYANLQAIREPWWRTLFYGAPSFSLELTVPHAGEEISFYIAAPKRLQPTVEKIIEGVFHDARISAVSDYNIFNPEGESAGAIVSLKRSPILPVKTYRRLEADPLRELANAFSKLAPVGEGAALQIVARPAPRGWNSRILTHARLAYEGTSPVVPRGAVAEGFHMLAAGGSGPKTVNKKTGLTESEAPRRLSPGDEEKIRMIEAKGGKPLFETNIRIISSAKTRARAEEILGSIAGVFHQFADPGLNEFSVDAPSGRRLKNSLYYFSFRIFDRSRSALLSSEELASLFHFPNVPVETPKLNVLKARDAAPPLALPAEGLLLGANTYRGETQKVRIADEDRRRHFYIIGQTGTGKSALMTEMIRQDILAGKGVCFIDPHGETAETVMGYVPPERAADVIYFDPGDTARPIGLNMLEYDPRFPEQKTFVVNELFSIFQKLYGAVPESMGPMFEQYFRNSTLLVMDDPQSGNTLLEIERVFADRAFRDLKVSRSANVVVKSFWKDIAEKAGGEASLANMAPYITSKFDTFLANEIMRPIIAQERSSFNFRDVMDQKQILIVNLSKGRLGELNSNLIGLIIVGKILMAALSRTDVSEASRPDFYLYIDEFQNVTTKSIATILSEARKYHLDLVIAHQFLGQLDDDIKKAVFGNVGSMAAFRIGSDDAEFLSTQFKPVFGPQDLLNIDNYHAYVKLLVNGQTTQPFSIRTFPPARPETERGRAIRQMSSMRHGWPRYEVEDEIHARYARQAGMAGVPDAL